MNTLYRVPAVITIALIITTLASCDSGGDTGDTNTENTNIGTGYRNGPGVPVSTLPVPTTTDLNDDIVEDPPQIDDEPLALDCGLDQQKQWVDDSMRDYYLFYDQVPVVNLAEYDSEEALLDDLRVLPMDEFSFVTDLETNINFIEQGKSVGFGYRWERDENDVARIARVSVDSPFGRAGVSRGDVIESVNGIGWEDISGDQYSSMIQDPTTWAFTDATDGTQYEVVVEMTEFTINTVLHYQTIINAEYEGVIGYLAFDRFLLTSEDELNIVMAFFREQKITDLVLDLRYNSGGRVSIARQLTSQIAGPTTDGKVFSKYRHNDKYTMRNFDLFLESELNSLNLDRMAVLTTPSTGSASEMLINGLRPYISVTQLGGTTRGKPYVTHNNDRCDKRLNALEVETFNANDVSVAGGMPANCAAVDDLTSDFGLDIQTGQVEGMLVSALDYLVYGTCNTPTPMIAASQRSLSTKAIDKQEFAPGGAIDVR